MLSFPPTNTYYVFSPFLFAIGMDYLSRCLQDLALNANFNYHPRCERLAITHLMFADDLLMFSRGDVMSVQLLYAAFLKFSKASSGLEANLHKSAVYFGGLSANAQEAIQSVLPVPTGSLPFSLGFL